ncbi:hypothetical protein IFM89_005880 [Coptis chinensis]|uniref:Uncharacterized protein n=1 Tax=Coptis chinensis TaxID=261450 RepID=A0A835LR05_9MAGN|nr:hypothetical protein IFM89_005880 [Coptis chinensis]
MRQVSEGVHHVPGIVEAKVENIKEVWDVLQAGSNARVVGSNNVNEHSSQSHWYFGAAKKLPGVRELFEKPPELRKRRSRYDIFKRIDMSYYGYRDDEDGILGKLEGPAEAEMRAAAVKEWQRMEIIKLEAKRAVKSGEVANAANILFEEEEDVVEEERKAKEEENQKEQELACKDG